MNTKADIILIIISSVIACIVFSAFIYGICTSTNNNCPIDSASFEVVYESGDYNVVYNRLTKVMYSVSDNIHNSGVFTLLVNPDGTPMIWED